MKNDLPNQKEFIDLFPDTRFRYIHDVSGVTVQGNNILDLSWNKKGYGTFFTVNGFPPTGEAKQVNLLSLNANYVDFDTDAGLSQEEISKLIQETLMAGLEANVPMPTIINRTQKGAHAIWLYPEKLVPTPESIEKWRNVQKRLVHCFKGDTKPVDPSRVLRVPCTLHLKNPEKPFEIKIMSYKPEARCTLDELDKAVPKYSDDEVDSDKAPVADILRNGVKVGEGMRHMAMAQVAGLALNGVTTAEQVELARLALYGWDRCVVKSPESFQQRQKELDDTIDGILKREMKDRGAGANTIGGTPVNKIHLWAVGDILKHDFGEEEWLVESLVPKQGMMVLSGSPGDYKTWVTIHIAICTSRNIPVFDKFKVTQGAVLIIDEEDYIRTLKTRLGLLGAKDTDSIHYLSQNGIKVDNEKVRDEILEIVKEKNIKLLILDSLVRVHNQDENDAKGMAKVFSSLQKIITAGASIIFTHHHRKQLGFGTNSNLGERMRGSSDILAAVDCHVTIERKRDEKDRLILRQTKLRQGDVLDPFEVKILRDVLDDKGKPCPSGFEFVGDYDESKKKTEEASAAVILILAEGMKSRMELQDVLIEEFGKTAIDDGIKLAEVAKKIDRVPKEELPKNDRRKAYYRLPKTSSSTTADDLPVSQLSIDIGKQEDAGDLTSAQNEWFEAIPDQVTGSFPPKTSPG